MKMLKKLALVSAVSMISTGAFAMEALDEETMSATTGQDGITILVELPSNKLDVEAVRIHDADGLTAKGLTAAGAIVLGGSAASDFGIQFGGAVKIDVDSGHTGVAANAATLNVKISLTGTTTINTGDVTVAASAGAGAAVTNESGVILKDLSISLGAMDVNIQLGHEVQGSMIALNTTVGGGITISNFELVDQGTIAATSGGSVIMSSLTLKDNAGADLTLGTAANKLTVDVDETDGLVIDLGQFGSATGVDVAMNDLKLGSASPGVGVLGDVELIGLKLADTKVKVIGH